MKCHGCGKTVVVITVDYVEAYKCAECGYYKRWLAKAGV